MADPATHVEVDLGRMRTIERAVADNLRDYIVAYRKAAPWIGAELLEVAGGVAAFVGKDSPVTSVKGVGPVLSAADVEAIEQFYSARGISRLVIEAAPWLDAASRALLRAREYFETAQEDVVVMEKRGEAQAGAARIESVPHREWPALLRDAYEMNEESPHRELCLATAAMPRVTLLGIRDGDRWVACAQTNPYEDAAILGCDGTLPSHRGHGLQVALIRERLRSLAEGTLAIAEVTPRSGSERNYLRCGFAIAYARTHFVKQLH